MMCTEGDGWGDKRFPGCLAMVLSLYINTSPLGIKGIIYPKLIHFTSRIKKSFWYFLIYVTILEFRGGNSTHWRLIVAKG